MQDINEKDFQSVPLTSTPEDSEARPKKTHAISANPDETYSRYEREPFRKYSLDPGYSNIKGVSRAPSKSSILSRVLSRQNRVRAAMGGSSKRSSGKEKEKTEPDYSLAGPRCGADGDSGESEDDNYGHYGRRPQAPMSLGRPFPRQKMGKRWRSQKSKKQFNKQSERGENGKPQENEPQQDGCGPAGGPAGKGRRQEDEDQAGNTNWVESLADNVNDYRRTGRHDSEDTLTEDGNDNDDEETIPNYWFGIRRRIREPLAEWLGTMVSVLMGVCANLQVKTSKGEAGSFSQEAAVWGLGTMMAIYIAGGISGAHCNPMVSINLSVFRGFPARKCLIYICAQLVGAICAVWIAFGIYKDAIMYFDPKLTSGSKGSGTAFFTLPASFATPETAFFTDFVSAAVMTGTIMAMGDDTNSPPGAGMHALIIGLIGFAMAACFGYNTGPQTNPAKDLATRMVPNLVGYGSDMWKQGWWAEAWAAAIFGGLAGCLIYDVAIFEGPESPINYPRMKRKQTREGNKAKWLKTGLFGPAKKRQYKQDLEQGNIGAQNKGPSKKLDGH